MHRRARIVAFTSTAVVFVWTTALGAGSAAAAAATEAFPEVTASTSLLVVSPHPDDESLCCAGVIQRVLRAGGRAAVLWMTSGDASELDLLVVEKRLLIDPEKLRDLGRQRMQEARQAASLLGVPAGQQFFLGYPDRGLLAILTGAEAKPYRSPFTAESSVPYPDAVFPGHPYTASSLEHDFAAVIDRTRPNLLLVPSPRDTHSDHRAAGLIAIRVLRQRHELASARFWIVHAGRSWPQPRGFEPDLPEKPPPRMADLIPLSFPLESVEEEHKMLAIRAYQTQMTVMSSTLLSYVRTTELYFSAPGSE